MNAMTQDITFEQAFAGLSLVDVNADLNTDDWTEKQTADAVKAVTEPLTSDPAPIPNEVDAALDMMIAGYHRKATRRAATHNRNLIRNRFNNFFTQKPDTKPSFDKLIDFSDDEFDVDTFDLVEGLIPLRGRSGVLGKYKQGKSVFCTSVGLHIAAGLPVADRVTETAVVVHVMSEGDRRRNKNRVLAWCRQMDVPVYRVKERYVPLSASYDMDTKEGTANLIRDVAIYAPAASVVIIDPLIENFTGEENSSKDMSAFMRNVHAIAKAIDGVVIIPHHNGMDASRGGRGSTAYEGAVDNVVQLKGAAHSIEVATGADRDHQNSSSLRGKIVSYGIGTDRRGREVSAPVFMFSSAQETQKEQKPKMAEEHKWLEDFLLKYKKNALEAGLEHWAPTVDEVQDFARVYFKEQDDTRAIKTINQDTKRLLQSYAGLNREKKRKKDYHERVLDMIGPRFYLRETSTSLGSDQDGTTSEDGEQSENIRPEHGS